MDINVHLQALFDAKLDGVRGSLADINEKLDRVLDKQDVANGRVGKVETEIAVLKERANPWTASGVGAGLVAAAGALYEYFRR